MIQITNQPRNTGFCEGGVSCVIADAAGDFVVTIRQPPAEGEDYGENAKVGITTLEARRLLSTLRSKGGTRIDEQVTPFAARLGVPSGGWVAVKTKSNGDVEFTGQESLGGNFDISGETPEFVASDAMYGIARVTISADAVPDFIDAVARLLDTKPESFNFILDLLEDDMDFKDDVLNLYHKGRYLEAEDLFHTRNEVYHKAEMAKSKAAYDALSPEEKVKADARRAEVLGRVLEAFRAPL